MISFSGVWVKIAQVTASSSAFYRVFFGGIFLFIAVIAKGEVKPRQNPKFWLVGICGFLFALDLYLYHLAIQTIGPGLGTLIPNFQVFILTAVGILFFKEKIRILFLISIPLAIFGLFLIVGINWNQTGPLFRWGVYCGLGAAVCYAGFLLSLRKLQADQVGLSMFYVLLVVSVTAAPFLSMEIWRTGDTFQIPNGKSLFSLLALGLFSQSMGWLLITNALPKVRTSLSGFILLLQPALAFVWDVWLFHRPTTWLNWIGVGIILMAIYIGTTVGTSPSANSPSSIK